MLLTWPRNPNGMIPALFLLAGLISFSHQAEAANPETLEEAKSRADAVVDSLVQQLRIEQPVYFGEFGRYWQGLPVNTSKIGNSIKAKAGGESKNWLDMGLSVPKETFPVQVMVDTYNGQLGNGYMVVARFYFDGNTYQTIIDEGPEGRESGWALEAKDLMESGKEIK